MLEWSVSLEVVKGGMMEEIEGFLIAPGEVAEFQVARADLEAILDTLSPGEEFVFFKMDSSGTVLVQGIVVDDR